MRRSIFHAMLPAAVVSLLTGPCPGSVAHGHATHSETHCLETSALRHDHVYGYRSTSSQLLSTLHTSYCILMYTRRRGSWSPGVKSTKYSGSVLRYPYIYSIYQVRHTQFRYENMNKVCCIHRLQLYRAPTIPAANYSDLLTLQRPTDVILPMYHYCKYCQVPRVRVPTIIPTVSLSSPCPVSCIADTLYKHHET